MPRRTINKPKRNIKTKRSVAKDKPSHIKSFYRPKDIKISAPIIEPAGTKLENAIWVPVALVLAVVSIGLNVMLIICYNSR